MLQFSVITLRTDQEWRGQIGGGGIHTVSDGLGIDLQMPCDAPKIGAVDIKFEGPTTQLQGKAVAVGSTV